MNENEEQFDEEDFKEAMADEEMEAAFKRQVSDGGIKLLHKDSGSPMFVQETKLIGQKGKKAVDHDESMDIDEDASPEDADLVSFPNLLLSLSYSPF